MTEKSPKTNWYLYFSVFSANLAVFAGGGCWTWTSPILPKLKSEDNSVNVLGRPITVEEETWLVSFMQVGLVCSTPVSLFLHKFFTKKSVLLIVSIPLVLAHILLMFPDKIGYFFVARFFMGMTTGSLWTVLPNYVAEIAQDNNRGFFGTMAGVMGAAGSMVSYLVGPYLTLWSFSIVNLVPLVLFYVFYGFFSPDSPYDLIIKEKLVKAEKSLSKLRFNSNVEKELSDIASSIKSGNDKTFMDLFKDRGLKKALKICLFLMAFQQLSGIGAVVSYTETIFQMAGSVIRSDISASVVGSVSLLSVLISSRLIDTMGRKILLVISCTLAFISLSALSVYFFLYDNGIDTSPIFWIPIVSLILYILAFNIGLAALPWVILGEVFSSSVKNSASFIVCITNYVICLGVTISFSYLVQLAGIGSTFLIFAVIMLTGAIYCCTVVPETKGKSFQDIQVMLNVKS
ncbi:facilitated trehalose transporter Tret1-like [Sitophilus oryzae]|uniref:Facilitated trehalose transporter Tret1-like n=1 Tax=Sitophilus oryzae TaxID=7048 RepID=A0A6J2XNY4_SITOR|nr:facilitated trehalose transporter Tret1-like [Sitophilus oryzae]